MRPVSTAYLPCDLQALDNLEKVLTEADSSLSQVGCQDLDVTQCAIVTEASCGCRSGRKNDSHGDQTWVVHSCEQSLRRMWVTSWLSCRLGSQLFFSLDAPLIVGRFR